MTKIVLWGMGEDYENVLNQVLFEIHKGNVEVVAVVCRKEDIFCKRRDGFDIVTKEDLLNLDFEYVVVLSQQYIREIKVEARYLGIPEEKIIDGRVLKIPHFDFKRYEKLLMNPVTILSDDCWGGHVYNFLRLPFTSPFVNIFIDKAEYVKLIEDPLYYLDTELQMVCDGNMAEGLPTIGYLGCEKRKVLLRFIHDADFQTAKEKWDRRMKRINRNNIFIKFGATKAELGNTDWYHIFQQAEFKKVLFCYGLDSEKHSFSSERYMWTRIGNDRVENNIKYYKFHDYMRDYYNYDLDILKLLTGEDDYSRYI